jgi:hypothetical protein
VALLYQRKSFRPTSYTNIPLYVYKRTTNRFATSSHYTEKSDDVLEINYQNNRVFTKRSTFITGFLDEEIHIIVNRWPSRSGGEKKSSPFRGRRCFEQKIMDSLQRINTLQRSSHLAISTMDL